MEITSRIICYSFLVVSVEEMVVEGAKSRKIRSGQGITNCRRTRRNLAPEHIVPSYLHIYEFVLYILNKMFIKLNRPANTT